MISVIYLVSVGSEVESYDGGGTYNLIELELESAATTIYRISCLIKIVRKILRLQFQCPLQTLLLYIPLDKGLNICFPSIIL